MRPGQQNKRGRGRGNNNNNNNNNGNNNNFNRKGSNPLTRTYDSSGPDVKIRGTAQHIAEKYATLARDAQSAGDRVIAENYLQHAEHYNRIIAAAQAQMQDRFSREDRADFGDRESVERDMDDLDSVEMEERAPAPVAAAPQPVREVIDGTGPQPVIEGIPAEVAIEEETPASGEPRERTPRRRNAGNRPRRQPRRANGEAAPEGSTDSPELADASTE